MRRFGTEGGKSRFRGVRVAALGCALALCAGAAVASVSVMPSDYGIDYATGMPTVTAPAKAPEDGAPAESPRELRAPEVSAPVARTLTYTGEAQNLVSAGSASAGATMKYSLSEDGAYSEEIPGATNAGSYTVWYLVDGGGTYSSTAPQPVAVEIARKPATVTALPQTVSQNGRIRTGTGYARASGLAAGHRLDGVTLRATSSAAPASRGTITPGGARITDGTNDVTENYSISYAVGALTVSPHAHSWAYSASGAVIRAWCRAEGGCAFRGEANAVTVTVAAPTVQETGSPYAGLSLTYGAFGTASKSGADSLSAALTVTYSGTSESGAAYERSAAAPAEPGRYTVTVTAGRGAGAASVSVAFRIRRAHAELW